MEICDISWHNRHWFSILGAKVQRLSKTEILVNGAILDFPDAVNVTWIPESDNGIVKESRINEKGEIENV